VEFCGGTHLRRAGHIGNFVIATEEAIAKGIRRIVALTGPEADRALNRAKHYEQEVAKLREKITAFTVGSDRTLQKALNKEIVELSEEISQSTIAYWKRENLRNELKGLKKKLDDADKEYKQVMSQKILAEAKSLAENRSSDPVLVHQFPDGASAKVLDSALKLLNNPASIVFSVDQDANKVLCLAAVSKEAVQKGLSAKDWIAEVCLVAGGKGGGKEANAQATLDMPHVIEKAVKVAEEFAQLKLSVKN